MSNLNGGITASVFERIAALDGNNYRPWAFSLKMLLKAYELWEVIEDEEMENLDEEGKAKKMDTAKWKRKDQLALSNIALSLKPSEQNNIYGCATAKEAWTVLKELYEGKGTHRFLSLLKSIGTSKLKEGMKMKAYIQSVRQTADQLSEMGTTLEKAAVVGFILNGLPEGYHYLVVSLESQVQTISYEDLTARLTDEEKRLMGVLGLSAEEGLGLLDSEDTVQANLATKGPFPGRKADRRVCFECEQPGHMARDCTEQVCGWCGVKGHRDGNCEVKRFQTRNGVKSGKQYAGARAGLAYANSYSGDDDDLRPAYSAVFG
jgi:gag-polypeptide of LTR copia-type/Zinc knuckle